MEIGVKAKLFNWKMRERRAELNLTQADLAELSGVPINHIGRVERLQAPIGNILTINEHLVKIAKVLDIEFEELFPKDYLEAVRKKILPRASEFLWKQEVSFEMLPENEQDLLESSIQNVESNICKCQLSESVGKALESLTNKQQTIIRLCFGFDGQGTKTLEEVASLLGITREDVRRTKDTGMRKLRHPLYRDSWRDYLYA